MPPLDFLLFKVSKKGNSLVEFKPEKCCQIAPKIGSVGVKIIMPK